MKLIGILIFLSITALVSSQRFRYRWRNRISRAQESLFSVEKSCTNGTIYTVKNAEDLFKYDDEYDCVYSSALIPNKVPEGSWYGGALKFGGIKALNPMFIVLWRGKYAAPIQCKGEKTYIVWNNVLGLPMFPGIVRVGPVGEKFAPGEFDDGRGALRLGYTKDHLDKECPDYEKYMSNDSNLEAAVVRWKAINNPPGVDQVLDLLRFVGRQPDGGAVYIGKSMMRDNFGSENRYILNMGFWYIINYDKGVLPEFKAGQSLPPLAQSYNYKANGILNAARHVLPFDNLLSQSQSGSGSRLALRNTFRSLSDLGTSMRVYWRGLVQNARTLNFSDNLQRFNNFFNTDRYTVSRTKSSP